MIIHVYRKMPSNNLGNILLVMVWNIYNQLYPDELFTHVKLHGETAAWAVPAVKMMVTLGYYGAEVSLDEDGTANFRSKLLMSRPRFIYIPNCSISAIV